MTFMMNFYTFADEQKSQELLFQVEVVLWVKMRCGYGAIGKKDLQKICMTSLTKVQKK